VRGYVPATDPFEANTTQVQLSIAACALQPACTVTTQAQNAPWCNLYAVDMSYSGQEGLVTDKWAPLKTLKPAFQIACIACLAAPSMRTEPLSRAVSMPCMLCS
jgi:hypothetical protein